MSIIPLKDSRLFKITESVISFFFKKKKNSNTTILNKCKSFRGIVDHITCLPCKPYNFSSKRVGKKKYNYFNAVKFAQRFIKDLTIHKYKSLCVTYSYSPLFFAIYAIQQLAKTSIAISKVREIGHL